MSNLVYNEMLKIVRKKRLWVIAAIVAVLVALFTYAQYKRVQEMQERLGTTDWRTQLQQQIIDAQNRLNSSSISDEWRKYLQIRLKQQQYYLEHDINPSAPGAPTFMRMFIENAIDLFLPLLVMVVAADLVSSEASGGTIKLLLTRPVKRGAVLLSKYIALLLSISFILLTVAFLSYFISGAVFGYEGWRLPLLTGFVAQGEELNTANVHMLPQWKYVLIELGLAWFVCIVVGTLTFMLSVLVRSTAAVMGIMLAALISGAILSNMVSSWHSAKYLFMVNLRLTDYISGTAPPIEGMTLGFSMTVLAVWGLAALAISFIVFTKRDIY
ncbi:ABC transporter permease [Saccharococcus caldoxylosilyticus]|uniref:ABC transporter permease n=1 Tax=Saccharococcus caldoxylosilyticus TaxID=81408 RepID=UPI0002DAB230|nr:ABC transporter permease [Parageobacillus caldoxylosilyticus]QXJ36802.1 ABC-2 family transporter protein [Parageobacillus caldoxylosilyticus]QXJ40636.1 ABC-2 family transporter protein [Parageobacillus caldoxylosilyticus]